MALIETLNLISSTMDMLIDFVADDEYLSKDFEKYLEINNFNIEKQNDLNDCLIGYILDEKTQDNVRVLDYFSQKKPDCNQKIIASFKKSFKSVFKINKILKNAYQATCLANEKDFELIPLVKMTNLRQIGLYDFIKARMIELDNVFYLLEIFDCFGQFREYNANVETIKCLIKYPESQVMYNDEKLKELQQSTEFFNKKFFETFKCDEIVTSNTLADVFLEDFNNLLENSIEESEISKAKYETNIDYRYFELNNDREEDFIKNATGGFSASDEPYDVGFFIDKDSGLYIIPFLGTFNEILKSNSLESILNAEKCVQYFMMSDKVSPNLIIKKENEFKNFIPLINKVFNKDFKDIREIIGYYKEDWTAQNKFSPTITLYNSKIFEKLTGMDNNIKENPESVGRNELCPCGSGKKYKHCCLNK